MAGSPVRLVAQGGAPARAGGGDHGDDRPRMAGVGDAVNAPWWTDAELADEIEREWYEAWPQSSGRAPRDPLHRLVDLVAAEVRWFE
jgi:hypothetical protein